jgi:hypothetical protein
LRETFRFVDKRIQCLSSAAETRNDFPRREVRNVQEEKVEKSLNKTPAIYHGAPQIDPVCVRACLEAAKKIKAKAKQCFTIKTINQSML